jgi:hypothetical protein
MREGRDVWQSTRKVGVAQWREGGWLRKVMDDLVEGRVANAMYEWVAK